MISRRELMTFLGATAASQLLSPGRGFAVPAKATAVRLPLEEFVESRQLLSGLRRAVKAMKARKESDPLSWTYQAAIHAIAPALLAAAIAHDPGVSDVFQKRYWNQCPHDGENSANFLPWHRAYTYHFERIVRLHTELDEFALPYWNYTDPKTPANRKFPKVFGIQHLDGDLNNSDVSNINPLYIPQRDVYFCEYEHPLTTKLPLLELTSEAVDVSPALDSPVFFGETERLGLAGGIEDENPRTRGLLESYPHDQIHRAVGGIIGVETGDPTVGYMAQPPTAAFDPIFSVHHTNIDRLWAIWSCTPGKSWGKLPSDYWFNERPWYFHDEDGKVVNEPRKYYFDYRALGIRFKDENLSLTPLALPKSVTGEDTKNLATRVKSIKVIAHSNASFAAFSAVRTIAPLTDSARADVHKSMSSVKANFRVDGGGQRLLVRLTDVRLGMATSTGFDVHVTDNPSAPLHRSSSSFVGSLTLFNHLHDGGMLGMKNSKGHPESFDVSRAVTQINAAKADSLHVVIVPYPLLKVSETQAPLSEREMVTIGAIDFLTVE